MHKSKPAITPMVESFFSGLAAEEDKSVVNVQLYQQMIGCLLYIGQRSRPDILVAVLILARFQNSPTAYCHRGAKRILRYLRGTTDYGVTFTAGDLHMHSFVDSDHAGDTTDRKSMSGFMVKLGDAMVMWGSKKQATVSISTCEAEYYAMTPASQEIIWIGRVLKEAGIKGKRKGVPLRSDNQAAIQWAVSEKGPSGRAKHIDVHMHFIRELVTKGFIDVLYVPSEDNDADMLRKPLGRLPLETIMGRLHLGGEVEEEC